MSIETLILFALSTIGMAHIIVDGSIMEWFRTEVKSFATENGVPSLGGVVDCYLCCGTWCGFLMGAIWISYNPFQIFACGCAGGFLANLAAVVLNWLEAATIVNLPNDEKHES
jgi:hypothetical protein